MHSNLSVRHKHFWLSILLFVFLPKICNAQKENFSDSLKHYYALNISEDERSNLIKNSILTPLLRRNTDSLVVMASQNLLMAERSGNEEAIANANIGMGTANNVTGNLAEALEYYFDALATFEEVENINKVALAYMAIGNVAEYPEDVKYYKKALETKESIGNLDNIYYSSKINLGSAAGRAKDYKLSFKEFHEAREHFKTKNEYLTSMVSGNIGNFYLELYEEEEVEKYMAELGIEDKNAVLDSAIFHVERSWEIAEDINDNRRRAFSLYNFGEIKRMQEDFSESMAYYRDGLVLAKEMDIKDLIWKLHYGAHLSSLALRNQEDAVSFYDNYQRSQNFLTSKRSQEAFIRNELAYEYDKSLIAVYQKNRAKQRGLIYGLIALALTSLFIYLFMSRRNARKRSDMQASFSKDLITSQEEERKRLSRELHDGIAQELILIKNKLAQSDDAENEALVSGALADLRGVSRALHPFTLEKYGLTYAVKHLVEVFDNQFDIMFDDEINDVDDYFSKDQSLHVYRIIQEAINNAIKHAESPTIRVRLEKVQNRILAEVRDFGRGFNKQDNVSSSLGMQTMDERSKMIPATLNIHSMKEGGSLVQLVYNIQ